LETLNNQPFQKQPSSRHSMFIETEQHELRRLPSKRYEYAKFKEAKAGFDYHVALDKINITAFQFVGQIVLIHSTLHIIEVFFI
jgi:hypothetical protein